MIGAAFALAGPLLGAIGGFASAGAGAIPYVGPLLKFFGTGPGRIIGFGLLVAAAYGVGWFKGDAHGDAQCVVKIEQVNRIWQGRVDQAAKDFADARKQRDDEVDKTIAREVDARVKKLGDVTADLEQRVKDYEDQLRKRPAAPGCLLGPDDLGLRRRAR